MRIVSEVPTDKQRMRGKEIQKKIMKGSFSEVKKCKIFPMERATSCHKRRRNIYIYLKIVWKISK